MNNQIIVSVPVDAKLLADAFVSSIQHDELIEFILALDLSVADAGFTEQLILKLATSLAGDCDKDEWGALVSEIRAMQ